MTLKKGQKVRVKPGLAEEFPAMWNADIPPSASGQIQTIEKISGVEVAYVMFQGKYFPIYLKIPSEFLAVVHSEKP